jgi:hypothetical protein
MAKLTRSARPAISGPQSTCRYSIVGISQSYRTAKYPQHLKLKLLLLSDFFSI